MQEDVPNIQTLCILGAEGKPSLLNFSEPVKVKFLKLCRLSLYFADKYTMQPIFSEGISMLN